MTMIIQTIHENLVIESKRKLRSVCSSMGYSRLTSVFFLCVLFIIAFIGLKKYTQKTMTTTNLKSNNNRKNSVCGILGSYCFHSASCCPGFKCVLDASLDGTCRPGNHPTANDSSSSSLSSSPKHTNNKIPSHLRSQDDDAFIPEQPEHYDESYNQNPNELLQVNSSESADSRGDAFSS